jgi:hypothetical protein
MAITRIIIRRDSKLADILKCHFCSLETAGKILRELLDTSFAIYSMQSHSIFLNLEQLSKKDEKFYEPIKSKTLEERICFCLTHEEVHHWLLENEGCFPCIQFDNIARSFMKEQ